MNIFVHLPNHKVQLNKLQFISNEGTLFRAIRTDPEEMGIKEPNY